jgi:transcriptional regulator with XRE-family HTH domain
MSSIGKNIKKIRGVKSLNQSDFADLFKLKRASIGAYEEGRAEPKLSTILEIANYFGISIDDLLKKDLSVNDLYHFDIFRKDLIKDAKHNLRPTKLPPTLVSIPFISADLRIDYFADRESLPRLPQITLPLLKGLEYRAFELVDNSMIDQGVGFGAGDVVIAFKSQGFAIGKSQASKLYLFEMEQELKFRRLFSKGSEIWVLEANASDAYQEEVAVNAILDVWQVERVLTKNISSSGSMQLQINALQKEIAQLSKEI